jgi:thioredoxin-related protein
MQSCLFKIILLYCFISILLPANAQRPESADSIIGNACIRAAKENKNVFIIFHASWCGWCRKMDSSINDKECKHFFDDNYIIRHLVVHESINKKQSENPGALELMTRYNGGDQGIPFWLIFDKNGKLLADSQIRAEGEGLEKKGENSGCPASAKEVKYFIRVLKETSRLTDEQLQVIEKRFRQNEN